MMTTPLNNGSSYLPNAGEGTVPLWPGTYAATVVNNHDPLGVGRIQMHVPQVLGPSVSAWAVPLGTYYSIPGNGETVGATFIGGDPSQPTWIGPLDLDPIINAGVTAVTYSPVEPANPKIGDVWYQVFTLDGTVFYGPAQIWTFDSGTSTFSWVPSAQSGAGTNPLGVEEPNVTGGTITGSQFIGTGTENELILYSGVPTNYNMIASMVSQVTNMTNTGGGTSLPGVVYYGQTGGPDSLPLAIQMTQFIGSLGFGPNGGAIVPWTTTGSPGSDVQTGWTATIDSTFGQGITIGSIIQAVGGGAFDIYLSGTVGVSKGLTVLTGGLSFPAATINGDSSGNVNYVNDIDGNTYRTGQFINFGTSGQTIASTSATTITGMSANLETGIRYHITGWVTYTSTATAGTPTFGFAGTKTLSHADGRSSFLPSGGSFVNTVIYNGGLGNATGATLTSSTLTRWEYDLFVTVSGSGTFTTTALTSSASDPFNISSGYMRVETF